jgi:aminoglycoside 3-N-acetyltransferase
MLPTFSIDGSMHRTLLSGRVFDIAGTPSNLGAIPEAFRRHPLARRSLHPTHSLAAIGPGAEGLVAEHHLSTSFGEGSPMARMMAAGGYLLGLGTDLGRVTFYHCLEEIEDDFPLDVFTADSPIEARCRDHDGRLHRLRINAHDAAAARTRIDRPENVAIRRFFQQQLESRAGLSWHGVGEASSWLVEAARLYEEARRQMRAGITIYSHARDIPGAAAVTDLPRDRSRPA